MKLISNDLRDGDKLPHRHVFNGMGYDGDNISPHLAWDDVPAGTKSFVVTCKTPSGIATRPEPNPCGNTRVSAGKLTTTQCHQPEPVGASGFNVHFHSLASASITAMFS